MSGDSQRSPLSAWWCEGEKKTEAKRIATGNRAGRLVRCAPALTHNGVDAYSAGAQRSGCRAERRNFSRGWLIDAPGPSQSGADGEPVAAPDNRVCHGSCEEHEPRQPRSQVSFFVRLKMKTIDPKSWRMWFLLCILLVLVIIPLLIPVDDLIFACRIRCGSEDAKQECSQWKESIIAGSALPHPWWTFSCMLRDESPWNRMVAAKLRYALMPDDPRILDTLIAETENSEAFVRGAAVWEFWDMYDHTSQTLPILERALFEDPDEGVRRSALLCLLSLSQQHEQAHSIVERAAVQHPVESTHEFARKRLESWNKNRTKN